MQSIKDSSRMSLQVAYIFQHRASRQRSCPHLPVSLATSASISQSVLPVSSLQPSYSPIYSHTRQCEHPMVALLRSGPSMDDERRRLDAAILQLVRQRNRLAPISCLPPELLACIFSWVTMPYRLENLLLITSICRHWRHVALADPTLWSVLEFNELDMALDFLERSRGSKLETSLVCGLAAENGLSIPFILKLLFSSMQRTKALKISCSQQIVEQHTQLFRSFRAPHLHQLHFHGEEGTVRIPHDLFNFYHPNLLHVSLWSASIPWDSPLLHSLHSLDLSRISETAQPSLSELLFILSACPRLERLSLNKAGPRFTLGEMEADLPNVKLPYLSSIYIAHSSIGMHRSAARILLSHLALPDNVSIELRCFSAVSIDMATLLPSNLQRWAVKPCLRATFSSSPWESDFEFILYGPVAVLDEGQEAIRDSHLKVSVSQNVRDPREVLQNFLSFLSTMSSTTCSHLELNFEDFLHDVGVHFWHGLFDIAPNLYDLIVRGKDTHSATIGKTMFEALVELRSLQPHPQQENNNPRYSRSANKLTTLNLHGINVTHPSVLGLLREFLLYRSFKLTGNVLKELIIHHSKSDFRMDLEPLEEFTDVVKIHMKVEDQIDYAVISRNSRMRRRRACASVFAVHDTFF